MSEFLERDFIGMTQFRYTSLNKLDFNMINQQKLSFEKLLLEGFQQEKNERDKSTGHRVDGSGADSSSEVTARTAESASVEVSASSDPEYKTGLLTQYVSDNQNSNRNIQRIAVPSAVKNNHYVTQGTSLVSTDVKSITTKRADPYHKAGNDCSYVKAHQEDIRFIRTVDGYSLYISSPTYENRLLSLKEIIRYFESKSGAILNKVVVNREVVVQRLFSKNVNCAPQDEHYQVNQKI